MNLTDHVLVAVVPVVAVVLARYRRLPTGSLVLVAVFAGLFPDLVDKPLAWGLGVVPSGRMVAHSLVLAAPLVVCVLVGTSRLDRLRYGVVFGWGYASHIAGDFAAVVELGSSYYYYPNLFWPLMAANPDRNPGFAAHVPVFDVQMAGKLALVGLLVAYGTFDLWRWYGRRQRLPFGN